MRLGDERIPLDDEPGSIPGGGDIPTDPGLPPGEIPGEVTIPPGEEPIPGPGEEPTGTPIDPNELLPPGSLWQSPEQPNSEENNPYKPPPVEGPTPVNPPVDIGTGGGGSEEGESSFSPPIPTPPLSMPPSVGRTPQSSSGASFNKLGVRTLPKRVLRAGLGTSIITQPAALGISDDERNKIILRKLGMLPEEESSVPKMEPVGSPVDNESTENPALPDEEEEQ
jgi:hypothetical protein